MGKEARGAKRIERDASEIRLQTASCIGVQKGIFEWGRERGWEDEGGDSPERIQHKYCPRPNGGSRSLASGDASPTTTWSPFPREKTRPPPRPSPLPLPMSPRSSSSYHLHRTDRPPPPSSSPPLLTGSDRHRHHRGAIAIAAKTNKTKRKAVANVAGGRHRKKRCGRRRREGRL